MCTQYQNADSGVVNDERLADHAITAAETDNLLVNDVFVFGVVIQRVECLLAEQRLGDQAAAGFQRDVNIIQVVSLILLKLMVS